MKDKVKQSLDLLKAVVLSIVIFIIITIIFSCFINKLSSKDIEVIGKEGVAYIVSDKYNLECPLLDSSRNKIIYDDYEKGISHTFRVVVNKNNKVSIYDLSTDLVYIGDIDGEYDVKLFNSPN